jgi:hypothetical protein
LRGVEPEGAWLCLQYDSAVSINEINPIRPARVGTFDGIVHVIDNGRNLDPKLPHATGSDPAAFVEALWRSKDHFVTDVTGHLPNVAGVSFLNVDNEETNPVFVLFVEFVERGNLPAKRRSGITAEDEHDGAVAAEVRQLYPGGLPVGSQPEIWRQIPNLQVTGARKVPERLER